MVLHFCIFLLNPQIDLEPVYIVKKPIKYGFQQHIVCTEIYSTFHARVEYISRQTIHDSAHSNECTYTHTDRHTKVKTVYLPASFCPLGRYNKLQHSWSKQDNRLAHHFGLLLWYLATSRAKSDVIFLLGEPDLL